MLLALGCETRAQAPNQQLRDSLSLLNKRILSEPYSSDLYLRKAALNLELEQWDYAIETYSDVLLREPKNPAALFYRAYAHGRLRHYDLARSDYEDFLDIAPQSLEGRMGLAYILGKQGKKKDALDEYNRLVEMFPSNALSFASRAGYETSIGFYDLAIYDWGKAMELEPENTDFIISKADVYIKMYKLDEAKECLDLAVKNGVPRGQLLDLYSKCKR